MKKSIIPFLPYQLLVRMEQKTRKLPAMRMSTPQVVALPPDITKSISIHMNSLKD